MQEEPFYISKRNRRGVFTLFIFSLIVVFTPRFLLFLEKEDNIIVSSEDIQSLEKDKSFNQNKYRGNIKYSKKDKYKVPERKFNPNQYSFEDWVKLGLTQKQATVVIKFTNRGINSNEELKKIFVIPEELFNKIKDSTYYPQKETLS